MAANRQLSAVLRELDLLVGCDASDRQWVTDTDVRWADGFILTGMDVGADRRAWRLTPRLPRAAGNWSEAGLTVRADAASGVLTVSPLRFSLPAESDGSMPATAQSCELRVPWGEVAQVPDSVAPLGLWILQSRPALPLSIGCGSAGEFVWPLSPN